MTQNNWMASLDDNVTLPQVILPGSHDACMYEARPGSDRTTVNSVVTQFHTIRGQLDLGTRFFDIRVYKDRDSGILRPGHFADKKSSSRILGEYGPQFINVVQDVKEFLEANTGEVVIIKFSLSKSAKDLAIQMIESAWDGILFDSNAKVNLASVKMGQLRGKLLALFDDEVGNKSSKLHLVSKKVPSSNDAVTSLNKLNRSILYIDGEAPQQNNLASVMQKQKEAFKESAKRGPLAPHLRMWYLTITSLWHDIFSGMSAFNVENNTKREFNIQNGVARNPAHQLRSAYVDWSEDCAKKYNDKIKEAPGVMNIYQYDFINSEVNAQILRQNASLW